MHYRMLATITLPDGTSSADARQAVHEALFNDESFCGEGGRFGSPLCDWFVIGGRWSGLLAETVIGPAYKAAVFARFPGMNQKWLPQSLVDANAAELDAIWREHGGTGPSPYTRRDYNDYEDDAMLVTSELYTALLAEYEGQDEISGQFVDLDFDAVGPHFIGRKWIVIVDYHQ